MGAPDPFVVVEAGAGPGTLARTVLAAGPECAPALRYVLVERSAAQRRLHAEKLRLEDPALAFAPVDPDTEAPVPGRARPARSASAWPSCPASPARRSCWPTSCSTTCRSAWPSGAAAGGARCGSTSPPAPEARERLVERTVPAGRRAGRAARPPGARRPRRRPRPAAGRGPGLAARRAGGRRPPGPGRGHRLRRHDRRRWPPGPSSEWVRTYRAHARGGGPLDDLGLQDVTCEVAVDQLALVRPPSSDAAQADWLPAARHRRPGGRGPPRRGPSGPTLGDLAALAARSRVTEADALLDPAGLGGFRVLEWA